MPVGSVAGRHHQDGTREAGVVRYALELIALTMLRPGELRLTEFDVTNPVWLIPAEKMKMRDGHEVPLSR
jgi:integrase